MLKQGLDVTYPYDRQLGDGMDFFSEEGKATWESLDESPVEFEHHAPDCKTMSRARGKPFWIGGRRYDGPPALRDEANVMGFKNLRGYNAVAVRQGNKMALRSVKRCKNLDEQGKKFTLEHPWRSFIWYMQATVELASRPGVRMAVFSNCCFGGRRQKWTALLTNCEEVYEELHTPDCPHGMTDDYQPFFNDDGYVEYPTEQEAEYPQGLCEAYARAAVAYLKANGKWPKRDEFRAQQIAGELEKYTRFEDGDLRLKVAQRILQLENKLIPGQEATALYDLLRNGHYRGTDVRITVEHQQQREMVPYPAYRWLWRNALSFRFKHDAHINELEGHALAAHVRRLLKEPDTRQLRVMVVLDSQVIFYAVSKGRSPSRRLNKILRKLMALQLFGDLYLFPVWTLSAWNYADKPSRDIKWVLFGLLGWSPSPCRAIGEPYCGILIG